MMLPGVDPLLGICLVLLGASRFWGMAQGRTRSLGTLHGDSSKHGVPQGARGAVLCPWLTWGLPKTRQNPWRAAPRAESCPPCPRSSSCKSSPNPSPGSPHLCALLLAPLRCEVGCFWPISPFFFFEVSVSGGSHPPLPSIKTPRRGGRHRVPIAAPPVRPPSARPALLEGCPKEKKEATEGKGARSHSQACRGTEPAARHPPHRAGRRTTGGTAAWLVGIREG